MAQDPCAFNPHRKVTISWTPNAQVANGTHNLKVYRNINGQGRTLSFTENSPATVTSKTNVEAGVVTQNSPIPLPNPIELSIEWTYELVLDSDGSLVESGSCGTDSCEGIIC